MVSPCLITRGVVADDSLDVSSLPFKKILFFFLGISHIGTAILEFWVKYYNHSKLIRTGIKDAIHPVNAFKKNEIESNVPLPQKKVRCDDECHFNSTFSHTIVRQ